ncbi:phage tail tube protein [Leucobacter sp. HY1910]
MAFTTPTPTKGLNGQSYEYHCDVAAVPTTPDTVTWLSAPDITGLQPNASPKTADGSTYANRGQDDVSTVGETFTVAFDAKAVKNAEGKVQPFIGLLIAAAQSHLDGGDPTKKIVQVRVYHEWIEELAWEFTAEVSFQRKNTGNADIEFFSFTLTSKGDRKVIANPALVSP